MFVHDFKPICPVVPPRPVQRAFTCFNRTLKPPHSVLESSCKPPKLKQFFNSPISMKVNRASLLSSRLHNHTVALIHTAELRAATTELRCWPLGSSKGAAEVSESCSRAQSFWMEGRRIHHGHHTWIPHVNHPPAMH